MVNKFIFMHLLNRKYLPKVTFFLHELFIFDDEQTKVVKKFIF